MNIGKLLQLAKDKDHYYEFLEALVKDYKPRCVLELGTYQGKSASKLASGGALVITVDNAPDMYALEDNIGHLDNVMLVEGDSTQYSTYMDVRDILDALGYWSGVNVVFFDSDHTLNTLRKEYELYKELFADECVLLFDDINYDELQIFWQELALDEMIQLDHLHKESGFGVAIYRK